MIYAISIIVGLVLGSIPFGLLIARLVKGVDIREHGSGNIGATNVARVVGKGAGLLTFVLDVAKGLLPALIFRATLGVNTGILAGVGAIAGHIYSPFLKFRGGKGVATSLGVFVGLAPITSGVGFIVWMAFFLLFRWVSLASVAGALAVPAFLYFARHTQFSEFDSGVMMLALLATIAVLIRHRGNIARLIKGKEPRFRWGKDTKKE